MTARVLVPLVSASGDSAQIFEAIAGPTPPEAHPAKLIPQISELYDFGLYSIGQLVREAVTRFVEDKRAHLWLARRNGSVEPWNLRISDLQIGRLSDENSRSAGLGLALAAIRQAFAGPNITVFATGELKLPSGPGEPSVAIGPVGGVRGKLMLIGDYIVQHRKALTGRKVVVALPALAADGRALAEAEAGPLGRLQDAARDAGCELKYVFAEKLDDFAEALGPFVMREIVTPKRAAVAAAAAFVAAGLFGTWWALAHAPVNLAFAPVNEIKTTDPAQLRPQRAHYDAATDKIEPQKPCYDQQRQPSVVGGETLLMRVTANDGLPFASYVRRPRIFIAAVSRMASPLILDADHFQSSGAPVKAVWPLDMDLAVPVERIEDEVRVFVVATRDPTIELTRIQDELRSRLQGLSGAAMLTTASTFLADRLGSTIEYQFKVVNDANACPN